MKIKFIKILFESFKGRDREKINYASSYNLPHRGLYDLWQVLRIDVIVIIIMSILPRGRSFTANSGTKAAVLLKGRSYTANSETQAAVLLGMDRCGSFPLLSVPHSRFSIWADLKRSDKIPWAPTWRWGEWIRLTGTSGLHRNSPQGLNIGSIRIFYQFRDPEIPINLRRRIDVSRTNYYNYSPLNCWTRKSVSWNTITALHFSLITSIGSDFLIAPL